MEVERSAVPEGVVGGTVHGEAGGLVDDEDLRAVVHHLCRAAGVFPRRAVHTLVSVQNIVKDVIGEDDEESDAMFLDIQGNLSGLIEVPAEDEEEKEPSPLTLTDIASVLSDSGLSEEQTAVIEKTYEDTFGEDLPSAEHLVDPKLVEANAKRKEKLELVEQVESLKHQLEETRSIPVDDSDDDVPAVKTYDVILRVKPEKVGQIHSDTINGQKCLIIPMDENEHAAVNGVNTTI